MTLNSSSSIHQTLSLALLTFRMLCNRSLRFVISTDELWNPKQIEWLIDGWMDGWMDHYQSLNILSSSKTEFIPIGFKQQPAKISSCSLNTAHSVGNLGFIFDEHPFLTRSRVCLNPDSLISVNFAASDHETASTIALYTGLKLSSASFSHIQSPHRHSTFISISSHLCSAPS